MAIKTGDTAPDFKLVSFTPSKEPVDITLSSFKGKKNVLLLFFPQAFTGGCTEELCTIENDFSQFTGDDLEILGISVDGTFVQKGFAKENNIKYPLLSDFNKETIRKYGIVHEQFVHGMREVARRTAVLVGKDGIVKYVEITDNPGVQINFEKLKEAIKNLN